MCGIFGYIGKKKNAAKIVFSGIKTLEYRGYDSWGIALLKSNIPASSAGRKKQKFKDEKIIVKKRAGRIGKATAADLPDSNFAFGHTRWATHGGVTDINAHPHLDCSQKLAIIHNGIIENYDDLKKELKEKNHRFVSETDTEVAIHLIEENLRKLKARYQKNGLLTRHLTKILLEAVRVSFNRFAGLNAIIVMDLATRCFVAAKNGSPLVVGKGKEENLLASDAHVLFPYCKKVYFVEDEELVLISEGDVSIYDSKNGKKKKLKFTNLSLDVSITRKGKFAHYMLKEIFDQPQVIGSIVNNSDKGIRQFSKLIQNSFGTYLVGCGTAAYACLAGTYIFSKIARRHINFSVGSEFSYLVDFLTSECLVLALSQSGETIDVIDAVKHARAKGAKISALVNVLGSTLYRISDYKLLLNAGTEKAVVSTKAFTAKLAYLILLGYDMVGKRKKGRAVLAKSLEALDIVLGDSYLRRVKELSNVLKNKKHIYIIGRGLSYPIALETALKIKEASYIHAEGFAAGELKHGVIALVEKNTPCITFLPNDETYGANLAGAMEMKARGGYIIGISYKPHEVFDFYLPVSDCDIASIIPSVVVGQLLGYFLAVIRNLDPDKPRNLAKSVTVK